MSTGHDLVDRLDDRVVVEHPARRRAGAHRDHPLRLEHLVVDLAQRRGHLVRDAAGDDQQVGLARRGAERLHPEARDVVAARRRSTSSRSRSRRARTCPATSTSSAPRRRPWRAWSARPSARGSRPRPRTSPGPSSARAGARSCSPESRSGFSSAIPALPCARCRRRREQDDEEDQELEEPEPRELVEDHGERVEEDDLDVEEDEEHRREVEADGEALPLRRPLRDAGLERGRPGAHAALRPRREARSSRSSSLPGSSGRRARRSRTAASR